MVFLRVCFVFLVVFSIPSSAQGVCLGNILRTVFLEGSQKLPRGETIKSVGTVSGRFGGQRILVQRKFLKPWYKQSLSSKNPQGDVRWPIMMLGEEAASFFGFQKIDENTYTVPDAVEINGAIAAYNKNLPENSPNRIDVHFYEARGVVPSEKFLSGFMQGQLPLDTAGFHDTTFNLIAAVLVPSEMMKFAKKLRAPFPEFKTFFKEKYPRHFKKKAVQKYFEKNFEVEVSAVDVGPSSVLFYHLPVEAKPGFDQKILLNKIKTNLTGKWKRTVDEEFMYTALGELPKDLVLKKALTEAYREFVSKKSMEDPSFHTEYFPVNETDPAFEQALKDRLRVIKSGVLGNF